MANQSTAVQSLITRFVADLETLFRTQALDAVRSSLTAALGGSQVAAKRQAAAPKKRAAKKPAPSRERRSPAELEATQHKILSYVKANPGKRAEDIKSALRLQSNEWALPITRLVETGQVKTSGLKRATTYAAK